MMIVEHEKRHRLKKLGGVKKLYHMMWKEVFQSGKMNVKNDVEKNESATVVQFCCGKQLCYPKSGSVSLVKS